jgi:hypothetical protein
MRQILKLVILLYPKPWRNRYANEFDALLDTVSPTWPTLFDVLRGAMKMQLKSGNLWKAAAAAALAAAVAGTAFSFYPSGYRSEAVIRPDEAHLNEETAKILSRTSLVGLIQRENLYEKERATVPLDDLALWLRNSILIWRDRKDGSGSRRVRVTLSDAAQAQRTAQSNADAFVEAKAAALVDPANFPLPERPPFRAVVQLGLVVGLLAGGLFALFNGLRVWKLVGALGVGGTVLGLAAGSVIPNVFLGLSVVSCRTSDAAAVRGPIDSATDAERLTSLVRKFNLYSGDPQAEQKLREHLTLRPDLRPSGNPTTGTARGSYDIVITFRYPSQATAQIVTEAVAAYLSDENLQRRTGITVEMIAPAFVHVGQGFPQRLIGPGSGLVFGLACAVMLGIWHAFAARRQLRHA